MVEYLNRAEKAEQQAREAVAALAAVLVAAERVLTPSDKSADNLAADRHALRLAIDAARAQEGGAK